ncbi:hypothetical protein RFI_13778, partial [Reticulomyxa filosa]
MSMEIEKDCKVDKDEKRDKRMLTQKKKNKNAMKKSKKQTERKPNLMNEHNDDLREALIDLLKKGSIGKEEIVDMVHDSSVLPQLEERLDVIRAEDIDTSEDESSSETDNDKVVCFYFYFYVSQKSNLIFNQQKKQNDEYDPSIICSEGNEYWDPHNIELLFEEVSDLSRGGPGGQFTERFMIS